MLHLFNYITKIVSVSGRRQSLNKWYSLSKIALVINKNDYVQRYYFIIVIFLISVGANENMLWEVNCMRTCSGGRKQKLGYEDAVNRVHAFPYTYLTLQE